MAVLGSIQPSRWRPARRHAASGRHRRRHQARRPALCAHPPGGAGEHHRRPGTAARLPSPKWRNGRSQGLAMHLDGRAPVQRRHGQCRDATAPMCTTKRALCSHFDSASLCLSKGPGRACGLAGAGLARLHPAGAPHPQDLGGGMPGRCAGCCQPLCAAAPCTAPGGRPRSPGPAGPRPGETNRATQRCRGKITRDLGRPTSSSPTCMPMWRPRSPPGWHSTACA